MDPYLGSLMQIQHIKAAKPILILVAILTAILGVAMIVAGVVLVWLGATGDAHLEVMGAKMSTTSVGLGGILCGFLLMLFVFRGIMKAVVELGAIGEPRSSKSPRVWLENPDGSRQEISLSEAGDGKTQEAPKKPG
jgi:hypothetical protein